MNRRPFFRVRALGALAGATLLALLALGCAYEQAPHLAYSTQRGIDVPAAPPDRAQVIFFVSAMHPKLELAIYDGEQQLGVLRYVTWFPVLVVPGDHRFAVVSRQSADFTVGRLEAGRTYILEAQNIWDYRYRLQPVTPDMSRMGGPITNLMQGCYRVEPNALTAGEDARRDAQRRETYRTYYEKWLTKPESDRRRMLPEHAIDGPVSYLLEP